MKQSKKNQNQNWLWKAIPGVTPLEKIRINAKVTEILKPQVDKLIRENGLKPSEAIIKIIKEEIEMMRRNETIKH